jgi:hypothetical protein
MKQVSLKKAIELFGGQNIELKAAYHYQYGFFEKDGQLYYINSGDDRMRKSDGQLDVMYRTAEHRKDWTGGTNRWDFLNRLNERGYKVTTCRVQRNTRG